MLVDLHMHSTFSDGLKTPTELIDLAVAQKLKAISLTDHDCLDGVNEAIAAGNARGIEVLAGVELSCEFDGRDLHVLGYGVDPDHTAFQDMLRRFRDTRHERGLKIVEKLNALGMPVDAADVLAKAGGGALGRPHIAAVLVEKGLVANTQEAFDKYIADGGVAYVPKYKMDPAQAIEHIQAAGGLAFIAHPGIFLTKPEEIEALIAYGFDGIEIYHPKHNSKMIAQLEALAKKHDLLVSGGTDYHGFKGRDEPLGFIKVEYALLERIKGRLNTRS